MYEFESSSPNLLDWKSVNLTASANSIGWSFATVKENLIGLLSHSEFAKATATGTV